MAIIESLGLEVCLEVRGQPLPEYDDTDVEAVGSETTGDTIVSHKYVEAQEGEEFLILLRSSALLPPTEKGPRQTSLAPQLFIDGNQEHGVIREYYQRNPLELRLIGHVDHPPGSTGALRRFRFSAISVVEDAGPNTIKEGLKAAKNLGTIRVEVFKAQVFYVPLAPWGAAPERGGFTLPEKALKGQTLSHATGYSAPVPMNFSRAIGTTYLSKIPVAIFNFKYRSRDALRNQLIIPFIPRAASVDTVDELSMEELREIARQHRQQVKKERSKEVENGRSIKREFDEIVDMTGEQTVVRTSMRSQQDSQAVIYDLTEE